MKLVCCYFDEKGVNMNELEETAIEVCRLVCFQKILLQMIGEKIFLIERCNEMPSLIKKEKLELGRNKILCFEHQRRIDEQYFVNMYLNFKMNISTSGIYLLE